MPQTPRIRPIYTPVGGPPPVNPPPGGILEAIGAEGVYRLLARVYRGLEASPLRPMFARDMQLASRRSAAFFIQIMGGGPLYTSQFGPPRMRRRHFPFEIDDAARQIWLECFREALAEEIEHHGFPPEHSQGLDAFLDGFSKWMVNVAPDPVG